MTSAGRCSVGILALDEESTIGAFELWLRNQLLPAVIIALGGVLVVRGIRSVERLVSRDIDSRARVTLETDEFGTEQVKRSRAMVQVTAWTVSSIAVIATFSYCLYTLGVPLSTLVAPATVVGVAVGFGAQQVVGDLLSGFFLLAERQFGYGDVIRYSQPGDTGGVSGTVEEMTLRVTKLRTLQGEQVIIPNGSLRQVTNLSKEWSRAVVDLPIASGEDVSRATDVLQAAAHAMADDETWAALLLGEPIVSGVESVEIGYLRVRVIARTLPGRQFEVARELRLRLTTALSGAGIDTVAMRFPPQ